MAKLEIFDGTNWIILGGQTNIALTGAVTGNGSSSIATTLNNYQTMVGSTLSFDWSNNGSFVEYSNYHTLEDSNPPPHFAHIVQSGSGSTYRKWLTVYKPGFGSSPSGTYEINFYHAANGFQYPFKIQTYGSLLRTYFGTTIDMQNNEIINAAYPTTSSSLATKGYADSLITTQLQNLSNIVTTGIMTRIGTNIFATRSLAVGSGLSITNADGVSGNPTINLTTQLQNLNNLNTLGFVTLTATGTGASTFANRTLSAGTGINIANGNGVSGNPTISLGTVPISSLSGYPSNNSLYLRGDGVWSSVSPIMSLPYNLYTSVLNNTDFRIYNSNNSATATGFSVFNQNTGYGVEFGLNNSTSEGYVWAGPTLSLKFGTNSTVRMKINSNGLIDCYSNDITTTGTINATTGTLKANNLSTYNAAAIVVTSPFSMSNNSINNAYSLNANYKITSSESGYQIYMRASSAYLDLRGAYVRNSKTSAIIETNSNKETASIAMNGDYIQTIQTFDDLGFIFTDEDNDPQSSWQSYISSSGSLVTSSSKKKKHSIRKKEHKNYLERLNKLNIYSYALKTPILDNDNEKTKTRKYFKNKQLHLGLLSEEVEELFDNCTDNFKTIEFDKMNKKEIKESIKDYIPKVDEQEYIKVKNQKKGDIIGIKYDSLLCYTILAIQELSKKVQSLEKGAN